MSTAINSKRIWTGPDRSLSTDPASTTSSMRPSFSSFSSFSSSITSVFAGRHSRTNSTSGSQSSGAPAPMRPASAAPQQQVKWVPRPVTPGIISSQSRQSRYRSTSSASAAAAALPSSLEAAPPPMPVHPASQHRRASPVPPGEGTGRAPLEEWKLKILDKVSTRYQRRLDLLVHTFPYRTPAPFRRRDSLSSGSSESIGSSAAETELSDESHLQEKIVKLKNDYAEEMRSTFQDEAFKRGVSPHPLPPLPPLQRPPRIPRDKGRPRDVLVEDDLTDEWTWRPEGGGGRSRKPPSEDARNEKWKEIVRQEQQVIWDTIRREPTPQQQQPALSASATRKVHFASVASPFDPSANLSSTPPSASALSASQSQLPSLPRTPHTGAATGFPVRSISAHPSVSAAGANRPLSPAVAAAAGVRPGSARPSSPAYTRWLPSTSSTTANVGGQVHGSRTGSTPIAIPRRNSGVGAGGGEGNGSAGRERTGSMNGSWRDWSSSAHAYGHSSGMRRDAPTPSPTAANNHTFSNAYLKTPSNSNLQSSASPYATVQSHGRTASSGNLNASHGRTPSNGNLANGASATMRRALTPGPVSSASSYARQRTASATQRAPSVPPVPSYATRERDNDREFTLAKEYTDRRDSERAKGAVVDDRDFDDTPLSLNSVKRVQATAGMGSRTSSNRSALVDEDAPPPEVFSSDPAPALRSSASRQSHTRYHHSNGDGDEEEIQLPKRDKGKGKAPAPPSPALSPMPLLKKGLRGMYVAQIEDFASSLRRDLGISAEA